MIPLAVDDIPTPTRDRTVDVWSAVILPSPRAGPHPATIHTLHLIDRCAPLAGIGRKNSYVIASCCQPPSHLVDMRFCTTGKGKVPCADVQYSKGRRPCRRG